MVLPDFVRLQLELECIGLNSNGEMIRLPGLDPDSIPDLYVIRLGPEFISLVNASLPGAVRERLNSLPADGACEQEESVRSILAAHRPCLRISRFRTYRFPPDNGAAGSTLACRLTADDWPLIRRYDRKIDLTRHTTFAVILDGAIVSTCESARENDKAAEAWVRTLPLYRQRGYGREVTAAWGQCIQANGKTAFYSHRRENTPSLALAMSLELEPLFEGIVYE